MGFPTTVILLFTKNMWFEPPAILQCDKSEFRCDENKENKISIDTSICTISECANLNKKSAW